MIFAERKIELLVQGIDLGSELRNVRDTTGFKQVNGRKDQKLRCHFYQWSNRLHFALEFERGTTEAEASVPLLRRMEKR